jgi:hypothetical protein
MDTNLLHYGDNLDILRRYIYSVGVVRHHFCVRPIHRKNVEFCTQPAGVEKANPNPGEAE